MVEYTRIVVEPVSRRELASIVVESAPLVLINAVGLTGRLLAMAPRLQALAEKAGSGRSGEVIPAVTCSAQATILTGEPPEWHGIVGNGWFFRDTGEVRFWQQSNALIQAEPLYVTARNEGCRAGPPFQGRPSCSGGSTRGRRSTSASRPSRTTRADGNKAFGIAGTPDGLTDRLEAELGKFPFHTFWGPAAGLACTPWIARSRRRASSATSGPTSPSSTCPTSTTTPSASARPAPTCPGSSASWTTPAPRCSTRPKRSAPGSGSSANTAIATSSRAVLPNRVLRQAGLLGVRPGPFGEIFDPFTSRAFAVCDHQLAHIYVARPGESRAGSATSWPSEPGVARLCVGRGAPRDRPRPSPIGRDRRPLRARRLVRLSVLARRRPGPRLCPDGRHPPEAGLRSVRAVPRPEDRACRSSDWPGGCSPRSWGSGPSST